MTARKSKRIIKGSFEGGFIIVASVFLVALFLKNAELASTEVASALGICAAMLIPALFPLTVASEIATETGAASFVTRKLCVPISKILGVSRDAAVPYFLGLLGGYTSSCKSAILLYNSGKISKEDCESIIAISNMPSLAFLTGFVGNKIFNNSTVGWILWTITVASTLILGVINRFLLKKKKSPTTERRGFSSSQVGTVKVQKSFSQIIVDAITHSAYSMLIICACVVFFSVLIAVLKLTLANLGISEAHSEIMLGTLEITRATSSCALVESTLLRATLCAFYIGWSGLCVHFQLFAMCEETKISFGRYLFLKMLCGIICALLSLLVFSVIKI